MKSQFFFWFSYDFCYGGTTTRNIPFIDDTHDDLPMKKWVLSRDPHRRHRLLKAVDAQIRARKFGRWDAQTAWVFFFEATEKYGEHNI